MSRAPRERHDVLIVVPPFSPNDTNPPLGPALLRRSLCAAGVDAEFLDLNIRLINAFPPSATGRRPALVGDHDKDRERVTRAKAWFREVSPLQDEHAVHVPVGVDPVLGMCFGFGAVRRAVIVAADHGHPWREFLEEHVFDVHEPPQVLGVSLMGPGSVFVGLVLARLARELWRDTLVVAGGSHVTALTSAIAADSRYGESIDAFLPGHSEQLLVDLATRCRGRRDVLSIPGVLRAGERWREAVDVDVADAGFSITTGLRREDLLEFDRHRVTIPMQLSRGCVFGRCTFCTYAVVEPTPVTSYQLRELGTVLAREVSATHVRRFSFKDSFLTVPLMHRIIEALRDEGLSVEWSAATMAGTALLRDGLLSDLAGAGCRTLEVGIESIWPASQRTTQKRLVRSDVERVLVGTAEHGMHAIVNLIYGFPGETLSHAKHQHTWLLRLRDENQGRIVGSEGILEINRGAPMARRPERFGIRVGGIAPWAFSHEWNAPEWLSHYAEELQGSSSSS